MKTYFYGYGYRDTKNWSCPHCDNYHTGGMDLQVDENMKEHLAKCPKAQPLKVVGGAPHGWGIWIEGKWHRVDVSEVTAASHMHNGIDLRAALSSAERTVAVLTAALVPEPLGTCDLVSKPHRKNECGRAWRPL